MSSNKQYLYIALSLLIFGVVSRFLPHPPNMAPITALALFGGAILPKPYGIWLPLIAIVVSDLFIGLHDTVFWTWGSFGLIAAGSTVWLRDRVSFLTVGGASLASSVLFYLLTNFGVWASGTLYPPTLSGLGTSYINGIPFFRNTLIGDLAYGGIVFGVYFLAVSMAEHRYKQSLSNTV